MINSCGVTTLVTMWLLKAWMGFAKQKENPAMAKISQCRARRRLASLEITR
jgi:hypothetical protein